MKLSPILICSFPFVLGLGLWVKDGARIGFWLTSVEEKKQVPIIEGMPELGTQTQVVWKEQFVSGIESPLLGLSLSIILLIYIFFHFRKTRNLVKINNDHN